MEPERGVATNCAVLRRDTVHDMSTRKQRSFRLDPVVLGRLDQRARDLDSTATALVERYVEEGLRYDEHPRVVFKDGPAGRRPSMVGSGLDVWEIVATVQDNHGSSSDAAEYLNVVESLVLDALRYYADYQEEIDAWITENDRYYEVELARQRRVADALG